MKDLTGKRLGRLLVLGQASERDPKYPKQLNWRCRCDCGNECNAVGYALTSGYKKSCGCLQRESRYIDLAGKTFGQLTAIRSTGKIAHNSAVWLWHCTCGNEIEAEAEYVMYGGRKSCGCAAKRTQIEHCKMMHEADPVIAGTKLSKLHQTKATSNTGVLGVTYHIRVKKYAARIQFQGKRYRLGYYEKLSDAAAARKAAEEKLHGDFIEWYNSQYPDKKIK